MLEIREKNSLKSDKNTLLYRAFSKIGVFKIKHFITIDTLFGIIRVLLAILDDTHSKMTKRLLKWKNMGPLEK